MLRFTIWGHLPKQVAIEVYKSVKILWEICKNYKTERETIV